MIHEHFFCPNPECKMHHNPKDNDWYHKNGTHKTKAFGRVQDYICNICGRGFSEQTFSIDYYAKKKVDYQMIKYSINSGSGIRQIARELGVSTETVQNRTMRLAKNGAAINDYLLEKHQIKEDLAADGFESFTYSQYFPHHQNILVGKESQFIYVNDCVVIRRKGRMTEFQKKRRKELEMKWKANSKGKRCSYQELILFALEHIPDEQCRTLYTDEDTVYVQVIRDMKSGKIIQVRTSSKKPRNRRNPLFPCNYIDRLIRKDSANHKRETVQWAKTVSDMMNRAVVFQISHNYEKPFRINDPENKQRTHAQVAGIDKEQIQAAFSGWMEKRVFFSKVKLTKQSTRTWFRDWENPLGVANSYVPKYACM